MRMTHTIATATIALSLGAFLGAAGDNPLVDAVKAGNKAVVRSLVKKPATVNVPLADGTTALHWAVQSDDLETTDLLLRSGADANSRSPTTKLVKCLSDGHPMKDPQRFHLTLRALSDSGNLSGQGSRTSLLQSRHMRQTSGLCLFA